MIFEWKLKDLDSKQGQADVHKAIANTKAWVEKVVVGFNFCPFAGRELKLGTIRYVVLTPADEDLAMDHLLEELAVLDKNPEIETTLIIYPDSFASFQDYLDLIELAEDTLFENEYEGVYQVASFHPQYLFAGSTEDDAANYTNRSPFPMLHLIREESLERAIKAHGRAEEIPEANINKCRKIGLLELRRLLNSCKV